MEYSTPHMVMSGTHGELWLDGEYMAEAISFNAEVNLKNEEIKQVKKVFVGYKFVGAEGKGKMKLNHVDSVMVRKMSNNIKQGKGTPCTFISKLDDPDAMGGERVVIRDVMFEKMILANWETHKPQEDEYDFYFSDYEVMDSVG